MAKVTIENNRNQAQVQTKREQRILKRVDQVTQRIDDDLTALDSATNAEIKQIIDGILRRQRRIIIVLAELITDE